MKLPLLLQILAAIVASAEVAASVPKEAWTEFRYWAYCFVMPEVNASN